MAYKYLNAFLPSDNNPSTTWRGAFQELLNAEFENSPTLYTIKEEAVFASGVFTDVSVRINHVIDAVTGQKRGDDYKRILFPDLDHSTGVGFLYYFDDNYWIVINSEAIKNLAASCIVKRCNNVLRWVDSDGSYNTQPCSIDYLINENRDYNTSKSAVVTPSGTIEVFTQFNSKTNKIKPNRRFLFGNQNNWNSFKVQGGGINNINNLKTLVNDSSGLLRLSMAIDYVNEQNDDLVNGIADVLNNVYEVDILNGDISGQIGDSIKLIYTTKLNTNTISLPVIWQSSNSSIATVDNTGNVSFISAGSCTITCYIKDNLNIKDTINAISSSTPQAINEIVISPDENFILEDGTKIYSAYLYTNDTQMPDSFTFTVVAPLIPPDNYVFNIIDGNHFSIKNISRYLLGTLNIECKTGTEIRVYKINLKGKW